MSVTWFPHQPWITQENHGKTDANRRHFHSFIFFFKFIPSLTSFKPMVRDKRWMQAKAKIKGNSFFVNMIPTALSLLIWGLLSYKILSFLFSYL